jgi:aminopeptidase N
MYQTLLGRDGFRKGMDLYFQRHDGHAVTCDDFRAAMADANGRDLTQFGRWYSQAGTPVVTVEGRHDTAARTYTLTLRQRCEPVGIETTSGIQKQPFHIPFAVGLIDKQGRDLPLCLRGETASPSPVTTRVLDFTEAEQTFVFEDVADAPLPSLLRNFSAPVIVEYGYTTEQLTFQLAHDSDPFNRWEAGQRLATDTLLRMVADIQQGRAPVVDPALVEALRAVLADAALDPAFRKQMLILPAESYLAERMAVADPAAIHTARRTLRRTLAEALNTELLHAYQDNQTEGAYTPDAVSAGKRALKNIALGYLVETETPEALALAEQQYARATNMTDRMGALSAMVTSYAPGREAALADFYTRFADDPLVIDKWFSLQAMQPGGAGKPTLATVRALMAHPAFTLRNPNRARSLIFSFCSGNPAQFHAADGSGYAYWAEQVLALDAINPQVSARLARSLDRWRKYVPTLRDAMQDALKRVAAHPSLSRDVREIVGKALA